MELSRLESEVALLAKVTAAPMLRQRMPAVLPRAQVPAYYMSTRTAMRERLRTFSGYIPLVGKRTCAGEDLWMQNMAASACRTWP